LEPKQAVERLIAALDRLGPRCEAVPRARAQPVADRSVRRLGHTQG
jgi:hypothetical protein